MVSQIQSLNLPTYREIAVGLHLNLDSERREELGTCGSRLCNYIITQKKLKLCDKDILFQHKPKQLPQLQIGER